MLDPYRTPDPASAPPASGFDPDPIGPPTVTAGSWLTMKDAAAVVQVHPDTIDRRRKAGEFPHARQRAKVVNAPWEIPVGDLISAGLLAPEQVETAVDLGLARRRQAETERLRFEVAALTAERDGLRRQLDRSEADVAFLRATLTATLKPAS